MILYKSKKVIFSILILIIFIVGFNVVSATDDFNQTALEQHNSNSNEQEIASSEDEIISDKSTFEVTAEQKLSATNEKILNDYYDDEDLRENTIFTGNSLNTYTNKSYTKNIKTVTAKLQTSLYPRALANKKVQYTFNGKSGIALTDSNGMLRIKINVAKAGNYKEHCRPDFPSVHHVVRRHGDGLLSPCDECSESDHQLLAESKAAELPVYRSDQGYPAGDPSCRRNGRYCVLCGVHWPE